MCSMKLIRILIVALLSGMTGAGCGGPVSRIRVSQLRALRIGMAPDEVQRLLGMPAFRGSGNEWGAHTPHTDLVWTYDDTGVVDSFRAVRLRAEFAKGRLVYVGSYRLRRATDDSTPLFTLNSDGKVNEAPDLARWFRQ